MGAEARDREREKFDNVIIITTLAAGRRRRITQRALVGPAPRNLCAASTAAAVRRLPSRPLFARRPPPDLALPPPPSNAQDERLHARTDRRARLCSGPGRTVAHTHNCAVPPARLPPAKRSAPPPPPPPPLPPARPFESGPCAAFARTAKKAAARRQATGSNAEGCHRSSRRPLPTGRRRRHTNAGDSSAALAWPRTAPSRPQKPLSLPSAIAFALAFLLLAPNKLRRRAQRRSLSRQSAALPRSEISKIPSTRQGQLLAK